MRNCENGDMVEYDVENDGRYCIPPQEKEDSEFSEEINTTEKEVESEYRRKVSEAKALEMDKWIEEKVLAEIPGLGQDRLSTTRVVTNKVEDEGLTVNARLVARGKIG